MKLLILNLSICLSITTLLTSQVLAGGDYLEEQVAVSEIFAPEGFDDNDEITIMIDGMFSNSCYKMGKTEVVFDQATRSFQIKQFAKKFQNTLCLMVMVPYAKEISLGTLPEGNFSIVASDSVKETLKVSEASNAGPDDHLYAPIDSVHVELVHDSLDVRAYLQGRFTNSCMVWDEIKLVDTGKTKQILPIVKLEDRSDCVEENIPFEREIDLPKDEPGRYLLHVRSLNGKAVNKLYSIY